MKPVTSRQTSSHSQERERIGLFQSRSHGFDSRYHLTRWGKLKRLRQMAHIASEYDILHGLTPVTMRQMLEALGPTFVKVGQILSMRSEMLPQSFCNELAKLRADVEPMSYVTVIDTLSREYGVSADRIFASIDPHPLGSASLAQVHRAKLVTGEDVAVKVQRPGVREIMAQDISIMRSIAKYASKFIRKANVVDLGGVVQELWETFNAETDFLVEADNLAQFNEFAKDFAYIRCPKPYRHLCTEHVVVMEYVDGIPISEPQQLTEQGYDLREIGTKLVDNYATQVLDTGFFHADPHPGNIIIDEGQIVLIDLGMTGRLSSTNRSILRDMLSAVARQNSADLANGLARMAQSSLGSRQYSELLSDLDIIISEYGKVDLSELDIAAFFTAITTMAHKQGIELPSSLTTVARALVTLEGLVDEFLPDVNMIEIISQHIIRSKSPDSWLIDEAKELSLQGREAVHSVLSALNESKVAARMLTRGQLRFNVEMVGSEEPIQMLSDMINRLTIALIVVGLFVGSSIVYIAEIKPVVFGIPLIGFVGYVAAFMLSAWIVIDNMVKSRRRNRIN